MENFNTQISEFLPFSLPFLLYHKIMFKIFGLWAEKF